VRAARETVTAGICTSREARDLYVMTWHAVNWVIIAAVSFTLMPCRTTGRACLEPLTLLGSLLTSALVTSIPALFHGLLIGAVLSVPLRRKPLGRIRPWAIVPTAAVGMTGAWAFGFGGTALEYALWYAAAAGTYVVSIMLRATTLPKARAAAEERHRHR